MNKLTNETTTSYEATIELTEALLISMMVGASRRPGCKNTGRNGRRTVSRLDHRA